MKPVEFAEQTIIIAKNQPPYIPFPAHMDFHTGRLSACWKLTWKERFQIFFRGVIWHQILTHGQALQPQKLMIEKPEMKGWKR